MTSVCRVVLIAAATHPGGTHSSQRASSAIDLKADSETIRAFLAIRLPEAVGSALLAVQSELKTVLPRDSTAWPRPENFHLTLRFLGGVAVARLPELQSRLRGCLAGFRPLDLICERLGCFPDPRFPRVVWAWVHDLADCLPELVQAVNRAAAAICESPEEARFVGHVTLARPKQINAVQARRVAAFVESAVNRKFGSWACREVYLVRSELLPGGSRYTPLAAFPLAESE